jgi:hypothetical protein
MDLLAQFQSAPGPPPGVLAFMGLIPCCAVSLGLGSVVLFIIALVQILSRSMPNDAKILWGAVAWLIPVIGPILWWTIGSKQNPPHPPGNLPPPPNPGY